MCYALAYLPWMCCRLRSLGELTAAPPYTSAPSDFFTEAHPRSSWTPSGSVSILPSDLGSSFGPQLRLTGQSFVAMLHAVDVGDELKPCKVRFHLETILKVCFFSFLRRMPDPNPDHIRDRELDSCLQVARVTRGNDEATQPSEFMLLRE